MKQDRDSLHQRVGPSWSVLVAGRDNDVTRGRLADPVLWDFHSCSAWESSVQLEPLTHFRFYAVGSGESKENISKIPVSSMQQLRLLGDRCHRNTWMSRRHTEAAMPC